MGTGKTHSRHFRLFLDEVNLSGDARTVGGFGVEYKEDPITCWSDGVEHFLLGHCAASIDGFQAAFNNTALLGSFTELKTREEYIASLLIGVRATPIVGDACFSCQLEQKNIKIEGSGSLLITVDLLGPGQLPAAGASATVEALPSKVFGRVLEPGSTSRVATLTGTSVDNLASSANGALGYLHVTVSSGGAWTLKIQDSANDIDWADLITFDAVGDIIEAEQEYVAGTIDQYTRVLFTRASGTLTACCTLVRL